MISEGFTNDYIKFYLGISLGEIKTIRTKMKNG